jgi:tetratricopeptide (TPR) repeat protein
MSPTNSAQPTGPSAPAASAAPSASASPVVIVGGGSGGTEGMEAFGDAHPFSADAWALFADIAASTHCVIPRADVEPMDAAAALDRSRAFLEDQVGADAMAAFAASPEASSASKATTAAAAAAMTGNVGGAAAALLAAAGHEPADARHLVNLAGVLPDLGLASEAIALLDAAEGMEAPTSAPYGADPGAVLRNNRGRALLALGQWDAAASVLEEAYEIDGSLSEAATNLSLARLCQGDREGAQRFARAGRYREKPRFTERDRTSTPVPEDVFDLSIGLEPTTALVPDLVLPDSPAEGVGAYPYLTSLKQELVDRTIERAERTMELQRQLLGAGVSQMTQTRNADIMLAISEVGSAEGTLAGEWQAVVDAGNHAFDVWDEHFGPAGRVEQLSNGCTEDFTECMQASCIPATDAAHGAWLTNATELDRAVRAWADAYYPIATAIAGHIGNEAQYELAMLTIQAQLDQAFLTVVSTAESFALSEDHNREICVDGFGPQPPADELGEAPTGEPCRMGMGSWSLVVAGVTINVECSDWSLEASTPGAIGVFVQVSSKGGETTVFAGPSASASVGPFSAGSRSGFYVRSGPSGTSDFGYRVEPGSTSVGAGPVSVSGPSMESMDFSFVGISAYLPGF